MVIFQFAILVFQRVEPGFGCREFFGWNFSARLCTRTELNSGLCCAADCIGDGSALGPALGHELMVAMRGKDQKDQKDQEDQASAGSFWALPCQFLANSLSYFALCSC